MKQKENLKSQDQSCKKVLYIGVVVLVIFVIVMALVMRNGYIDAVEDYYKYEFTQYSSAHDYAMQDRVYFLLPICLIIAIVWISLIAIIYAVKKNKVKRGNMSKNWGKKITLENIISNPISIIIAICVIGLVVIACLVTSQNDYSDVFQKDPNTWTDDEKDYVNDFADWFDENN